MGAGGRRPRTVAVLLAAVLAAAVATVSWAWFAWYPHHRPALRTGESLGIDVSHHQGRIDWARVAADGVAFAYVKASEGGTVVDDRFRENWAGSRAAGVRRGAYHFFTLCRSGTEQARLFLRTVPRDPAALPPAVDLELAGNCASRPSRASVRRELDAFLTAVERSSGRDTVLYVGEDWQDRYPVLGRSARPAWLVSFLGRPDTSWSVWQVSWRGRGWTACPAPSTSTSVGSATWRPVRPCWVRLHPWRAWHPRPVRQGRAARAQRAAPSGENAAGRDAGPRARTQSRPTRPWRGRSVTPPRRG